MSSRVFASPIWRNSDFVHLWGASTISIYGTLVTRTALPFAAILLLNATPASLSLLRIAELLPAFLVGLFAGAWVDRLRRRSVMIVTDLARAALLVTIPVAALVGLLGFPHLYLVSALVSVLSIFFDVAYQAHLPAVVRHDELIDANSKISAAGSVAEAAAFSSGGWLVQLLTAPIAILVDAATFVVSAGLVARLHKDEVPAEKAGAGAEAAAEAEAATILADVREGLLVVWHDPLLRAMIAAGLIMGISSGIIGTVILLYLNQVVGFNPGVLGLIFAVGGVSSFLGAMIAGRLTRFGVGTVMVAALFLAALGEAFIPLATAANAIGIVYLVLQQLIGDAAFTIYDINEVSLRQAIAPAHMLGRVNACVRVTEFGSLLVGTVLAGLTGEAIGPRNTLWLAVAITFIAAGLLFFSRIRQVQKIPTVAIEVRP
jgi:MFS family permease